jgi:drug/metabolite transporter (DMT)-like permease
MKLAAALGTVYVVWGSTYLAIAIADRSLPPFLMLSVRFLIAGALLYAWSMRRGEVRAERPGPRQWRAAAVVGGLLLVVDTGGVAWAELRVSSGIAALLVASVPLFMAILDRVFFGIRLPLGAVAGLVVGLAGVGLLAGVGGHLDMLGVAVLLVASFAWAAGSSYSRVASLPANPVLSSAMQMLAAGAMLAVVGATRGELGQVHPSSISAGSRAAVAFLIVFGSLVAFTAYGWLLRNAPMRLLSTYAYVNPAVAVLLGWAILGEPIGGREVAAGLVILSSIGLLLFAREPRPDAEPTAESLPSLIREQEARDTEIRSVPRLSELGRVAA